MIRFKKIVLQLIFLLRILPPRNVQVRQDQSREIIRVSQIVYWLIVALSASIEVCRPASTLMVRSSISRET